MNGGAPDWQSRARRFAATVLIVAVALYVAVEVLREVLPFLVISATVIGVVGLIVAAVQARRRQW